MAKLSHTDSRRMYSWWWDSHISPKNSKWLQQNLTDMDVKVKSMIKLIEVDEDSFARRAEMYYKKRPELMKMVEEFYRAYRALAERYDHATGVIRHAHKTMSEAQIPMMFADESPASSVSGTDPRTPDSQNLMGEFTDESDNVTRRKTLKPFNDSFGPVERVRRGLNFDEAEEKEGSMFSNGDNRVNDLGSVKLDQESDSKEIKALKEAIAKLEAEKEAGFAKYQQTLDKLSQLETEISKTRDDFSMLRDHATKSDTEVSALKDALATSEAEKESKLQDYQKCLDKISELQTTVSAAEDDAQKLNERANDAEIKAQSLRTELEKLAVEKDTALDRYMQSLGTISNLENKLRLAEEDSSRFKERAEKAETEVESLRREISKLTEEKDTVALQYKQCLETISDLEQKLTVANEEAKRLNGEIENGVSMLVGAKEQCLMLERSNQSLHSELESLTSKMGAQSQELIEKQKELGKLWACVQEERLRFVDAETAFQTLQHLHARTQEELRAMASEMQSRAELLKVAETQKQNLQDEVLRVKEENKHLDELNSSSASSIKDMQNEICVLTESKERLEKEVELRIDQRNALQQEIYCLKEELNDLNKKHLSVLDQVHEVGLNPESLRSSVKELQDENSNLKETCQRESMDKAALLQKLEVLEHLLEKNSLLETSLSDLNAELDAVRGKIVELEQSCKSLMEEKSMLLDEKEKRMTQLQETNKNLEKLSENNKVLENSLCDAQYQLEALKAKSKILEDSCQLLVNEKADLICQKDGLTSQLDKTQRELVDLQKLHGELEGRCEHLENEKESTLRKVEELQMSLEAEKQQHIRHIEVTGAQLTEVQSEMYELQEECLRRKKELDRVLDIAIASDIEIFVFRTTAQVLKENNCSLVTTNRILLEKSSLSEKEISRLEQSNIERQSEIRSLTHHVNSVRSGTRQLLKVLSIPEERVCADNAELDNVYINQLLSKLHHLKKSLSEAEDVNLEQSVALSVLVTWLEQLGLRSKNVEVEKDKIEHELKIKTEQVLQLQSNLSAFLEMNEGLMSKLREGDRNKEALIIQIENLNKKLTDLQDACQDLQREKLLNSEEKRSLLNKVLHLEEKHNVLEEENHDLCDKVLALENLSLIFRRVVNEELGVLRELGDDWNKLNNMNAALVGKLSMAEGRFEESKLENLHLSKERRSLMDEILHLEEKHNVLEEENYDLCSRVLALENMSLIFRSFSAEKLGAARELRDDWNILNEMNAVLKGKLSMTEGRLEDSKLENIHLKERLQKIEDEFKVVSSAKDQLSIEIDNRKEVLQQMAQELQEAQDKITLAEKKKLELNRSVEDLRVEYNDVKMARDDQENKILSLSTHNDHLSKENMYLHEACQKLEFDLCVLEDNNSKIKFQEESLKIKLESKMDEISELESRAASLFGQLQYSMINQVLYEQKFNELNDACLGYIDQNENLKNQLAAFGPEIASLKECISSLEDHADINIKFQVPENGELQGSEGSDKPPESSPNEDKKVLTPVSNLRDLRVRLQAIAKAAVEMKELKVQENIDLHSKLDESTRQIELLKSEIGRQRGYRRPTSEITEEDNALLTKDIVLDQISDGSYRYSKKEAVDLDNEVVELWETADPDGKPNRITSPSASKTDEFHRSRSVRKQKGGFGASDALNEEDLSVDKLEIPRRSTDSFQGNRRKVLGRLDSDVQKLANLQITVQDLKRKIEVTEKGKRGKAVIECETLKRQLEEADMAVMKLFDLNGKLMKSLDGTPFSDTKSSFDFEGEDGAKRRRVSEQARRMSEKIGRLQLEVQKLQFVLLKLDNENEGRSMMSESKRRVLLRDYLYGGGQRRKKSHFCACVQPSTVED